MISKTIARVALVTAVVAAGIVVWSSGILVSGEPLGDVVTLAEGGLPALASLPGSDRFLLVWDMGLTSMDGTTLRARFFDEAGEPLGEAFPPTSPRERAGIPSIAANPQAREYLLTWWDFRGDGMADIYGQRLAEDGALIGEAFLIAQASNFENWPPAVTYNSVADEYLVVWYQAQEEDTSIYGQRVSAQGSPLGDVMRISDQGTPEVRPAVAASSATGEYLVVWSLIGPGLEKTLFAQRLLATGDFVGEAITVGQGDKPALTYNPVSDEYLVVWADGSAQAARVQPNGTVIGGISLSDPGDSKNFSDVAAASSGNYLAVWEGPGGDEVTIVLGRELSSSGESASMQWPLSGPTGRNLSYPAVSYNADEDVYLVVWEEWLQEARTVRGRIYRPGELPQPPTPQLELVNGDFEDGFYHLGKEPFGGQSIANGWAPYVLVGQPSFAGERTTIHGDRWAYKVSGYAPFTAGLAQVIQVQPGKSYRVTAHYQLYPPGDGSAFLGVRDGISPTQWVGDSFPGTWRSLSQVVIPNSDRLTITLQGSNGDDPNTNVYFDDVTVSQVGSGPPMPGEGPFPGVVTSVDMGLPLGDCYRPGELSLDEETGLLYVLGYGYEQEGVSCVAVLDPSTEEILDLVILPWRSLGPMNVAGGNIYMGYEDEHFNDYLALVDAASQEVLASEPVEFLSNDQTMLVDLAAGRLYLAVADRVEIRSSGDLSLIDSLPLDVRFSYKSPNALAVGGGRLYVAQNNQIEVYDSSTLDLLTTYQEDEGLFYGLKLSADGSRLYARLKEEGLPYGEFNEELLSYDTATDELAARLGPYDGAITAWDEDTIYLINFEDSRRLLTSVDVESDQALAGLTLAYPSDMLWDSVGGSLHISYGERHSLRSVDLEEMTLGDYIPLGIELKHMLVDSDAGRVYVGDSAGRVHVLDSATYQRLATLPGRGRLTLDAANQRLYVSEDYGEEVTALDLATLSVAGSIPEGGYVSVDSEGNRVFVGHYIGYEGPRPGDEGVRVFDGETLEQIDTASMSGIPAYNPRAGELYVINLTAHILDGQTLEVIGDLTPDVTRMNETIPWCNGCSVVTDISLYPERNLLVVDVTPLAAGKGAGYYPPPRFFDATTRQQITRPVILEDTCLGEMITDPIDGRIYEYRYYSRYVFYQNEVVYNQAGEALTWLDGIGEALPNPLTQQAYVPRSDAEGDYILVLDLNTLSPVGRIPSYCLHTLDFSADRLYALEASALYVLASSGGEPLAPPPTEPFPLPDRPIRLIQPSPNYAVDGTVFVVSDRVYRSTDGGASWDRLAGGLPVDQSYDVALSPAFPDDRTLFAGMLTGESRGNGVYRSTDGGDSWGPMWQGLTHLRVTDVVVSPQYATDQTLLAYAHYNNLLEQHSGDSVFRSTDGGESWTLVAMKRVNESGELPTPEELLPLPPMPVRFRVADYGNGIARSTDGGATWQTIQVFSESRKWWQEIQEVVTSPRFEGDNTVYALAGDALYRSTDRGDTWQVLADEPIGERNDSNYLRVIALSADQGGRHYIFLGSNVGDFIVIQPEIAEWRETDSLVPPS